MGNYKYRDDRTSFVMQPSVLLNDCPSPDKYEKVGFDFYLNKTQKILIQPTHLPRFRQLEKSNDPGPNSYFVEDAVTKSQWASTKYSIGNTKKECYFDEKIRHKNLKNKSPGPGAHKPEKA